MNSVAVKAFSGKPSGWELSTIQTVNHEMITELTQMGRSNDLISSIISCIQSYVCCPFTIDVQDEAGNFLPASDDFQHNVLDIYYEQMIRDAVWNICVYGYYGVSWGMPHEPYALTTDAVPKIVDVSRYQLYFRLDDKGQREYDAVPIGLPIIKIVPFVVYPPSDDGTPQSPLHRSLGYLRRLQRLLEDAEDASFSRTHPPFPIQQLSRQAPAPGTRHLFFQTGEAAIGMTEEDAERSAPGRLRQFVEERQRPGLRRMRSNAVPPGFLDNTYVWMLPEHMTIGSLPTADTLANYNELMQFLVEQVCSIFQVSVASIIPSSSRQTFAANVQLAQENTMRLVFSYHRFLSQHLLAIYLLIYGKQEGRGKRLRNIPKVPVVRFQYSPRLSLENLREIFLDHVIDHDTYNRLALQYLGLPPTIAAPIVPGEEMAPPPMKKEKLDSTT